MFLRATIRWKDGKLHRYWIVAESRHVVGNRVAQRPRSFLGEINDPKFGGWVCSFARIAAIFSRMISGNELVPPHPAGEQSLVEYPDDQSVPADTFAGRVHTDWDPDAPVTPSGQMAFFIDFPKSAGLEPPYGEQKGTVGSYNPGKPGRRRTPTTAA